MELENISQATLCLSFYNIFTNPEGFRMVIWWCVLQADDLFVYTQNVSPSLKNLQSSDM